MVSNNDNWVRIFDMPEISKHKKGFTLYKVISYLYPERSPDAATKITVWKRFNDFKKLHREMKVLHKSLGIRDRFPSLPSSSFFKRFDEEVVEERRQCAYNFLFYVAAHSQLYTSNVFVKFFETSHTPADHLKSNINNIRAELNLPEDPEFTFSSLNSDDERTISDTDSVSTLSSLSPSVQVDILQDPFNRNMGSAVKLPKVSSADMPQARAAMADTQDSMSISTSSDFFEGQIYPTPPNTPGSSILIENPTQYILDASYHINLAAEFEMGGKYEEAFTQYKAGIDILLKNVKGDKDCSRKQTVRFKIERYLLRAEKIYNMYLSPEIRNMHELGKISELPLNQHSVSDLYKYKVIRIIASGMLVLHSETQKLFYIKVVHKSTKFNSDNLLLPESVPYMVKLYNYYNCENAIFLVLEYCSGIKLWDYIREKNSIIPSEISQNGDYFADVANDRCESDNESDHSYSDLINDYTTNKIKSKDEPVRTSERDSNEDSDVVFKSQHLLSSVDLALKSETDAVDDKADGQILKKLLKSSQRQSSDRSLFEDYDFVRSYVIPIEDIVKWAAQLVVALEKLHKLGIVCCDLQSKNLLINESGDLVLTYVCSINQMRDVFGGDNDLYLAPEIYTFGQITPAVDWWGFGTILYELLVGEPLKTLHPEGLNNYSVLKIPNYVTPEGRSLLKQLLMCETSERLGCGLNGAEDLKSHPFFSGVSWDSVLKSKV